MELQLKIKKGLAVIIALAAYAAAHSHGPAKALKAGQPLENGPGVSSRL